MVGAGILWLRTAGDSVMWKPPGCDCHCCENEARIELDPGVGRLIDGDLSAFTLATKTLGGAVVDSYSTAVDDRGFYGPATRLRIRWTQPQPPILAQDLPYPLGLSFTVAANVGTAVWLVCRSALSFNPVTETKLFTSIGASGNVRCLRRIASPSENAQIKLCVLPVGTRGGVDYGPVPAYRSAPSALNFLATTRLFEESSCWLRTSNGAGEGSLCHHARVRSWSRLPKIFVRGNCVQAEDYLADWSNMVVVQEGHIADLGYYYMGPHPFTRFLNDETNDDILMHSPATLNMEEDATTTFGFAIGFVGSESGTYEVELLMDNFSVGITTPDPPTPCGTATIDEPLDSLPGDWHTSRWVWSPTKIGIDDSGPTTPVAAIFESVEGKLTVDESYNWFDTSLTWRTKVYGRGSAYKILDKPDVTDPNCCVTVEARLWFVADRDHEWYDEERPFRHSPDTGDPDNDDWNQWRSEQQCGLFIGSCARFGMTRNRGSCNQGKLYSADYGEIDCSGLFPPFACDNPVPISPSIGGAFVVPRYEGLVGDLYFDGDDGDDTHCASTSAADPAWPCRVGGVTITNGPYLWQPTPQPIFPQHGDLVRIEVKRQYPTPQTHPGNCPGFSEYDYPMHARVWINNRFAGFSPSFLWLERSLSFATQMRVGVYAKYGGRWSDFRCWVRG